MGARPKFCDVPREAPSSGLQYVRVVFHLLRGDLAVAGVLGRAQRPGVGLGRALPPRPVADAAHQILDGRPHLLVLVGVDAGVHDRVEHGQQQQPALQLGHVALGAVEAVHQQDDQAGSPTHHEGPCNTAHGSIQVLNDFFVIGVPRRGQRVKDPLMVTSQKDVVMEIYSCAQ